MLLLVVGCPGSGKTRYLENLRSRGELDEVIPDGLEKDPLDPGIIAGIGGLLKLGKRVGVCGQTMSTARKRRQIKAMFDAETHFEFFEPNYRACLANIVRDALAGRGQAWHRACCVYAMEKERRYELPDDAVAMPVFERSVTPEEAEAFFSMVAASPRQFSPEGETRMRQLLAPESCRTPESRAALKSPVV